MIMRLSIGLIIAFFSVTTYGVSRGEDTLVNVGVLTIRSPEWCLKKWSPTAEYFTDLIPGKTFVIVPLGYDQIHSSVEKGDIDFILANPSFYVELESWYGVNRIATLKKLHNGNICIEFN